MTTPTHAFLPNPLDEDTMGMVVDREHLQTTSGETVDISFYLSNLHTAPSLVLVRLPEHLHAEGGVSALADSYFLVILESHSECQSFAEALLRPVELSKGKVSFGKSLDTRLLWPSEHAPDGELSLMRYDPEFEGWPRLTLLKLPGTLRTGTVLRGRYVVQFYRSEDEHLSDIVKLYDEYTDLGYEVMCSYPSRFDMS